MNLPEIFFDSIVVAGGGAVRLNGVDKAMLPLGVNGSALLLEVIQACPAKVIVVGKARSEIDNVIWVQDLVPDGGPAAGIWSGLTQVNTEYVFISAGDQRITLEQVQLICQAAIGNDGAWAVREDGTGQPLLACVRTDLIRNLLAESGGVNQSPLRLMQQLKIVPVEIKTSEVLDIDTWADVKAALKEQQVSDVTPIWLTQVAALLGIPEAEVPVNALLDLTREVAHNVERKSAPLTTYLVGLAVGKTGEVPQELIHKINEAVTKWSADE